MSKKDKSKQTAKGVLAATNNQERAFEIQTNGHTDKKLYPHRLVVLHAVSPEDATNQFESRHRRNPEEQVILIREVRP